MAPSTGRSAGTSSSRAPVTRRRQTASTSRSAAAPRTSTSGPAETNPVAQSVVLARHGETAWSLSGRHTGTTDLPLTPRGEENARDLGRRLAGIHFDAIYSSPLQRARRTAELAGFPDPQLTSLLREVDYGTYEGLTTRQIHDSDPAW